MLVMGLKVEEGSWLTLVNVGWFRRVRLDLR
jgi:hypothetical protein